LEFHLECLTKNEFQIFTWRLFSPEWDSEEYVNYFWPFDSKTSTMLILTCWVRWKVAKRMHTDTTIRDTIFIFGSRSSWKFEMIFTKISKRLLDCSSWNGWFSCNRTHSLYPRLEDKHKSDKIYHQIQVKIILSIWKFLSKHICSDACCYWYEQRTFSEVGVYFFNHTNLGLSDNRSTNMFIELSDLIWYLVPSCSVFSSIFMYTSKSLDCEFFVGRTSLTSLNFGYFHYLYFTSGPSWKWIAVWEIDL